MPVVVRMRMIVLVVVRMFVMVMTGGGHDRLKDFFGFLERDVVALEHLAYGEVVLHQQVTIGELSGEVKVADLPSPVGSFARIGVGNLENGLRELLDEVVLLLREVECIAVVKGS